MTQGAKCLSCSCGRLHGTVVSWDTSNIHGTLGSWDSCGRLHGTVVCWDTSNMHGTLWSWDTSNQHGTISLVLGHLCLWDTSNLGHTWFLEHVEPRTHLGPGTHRTWDTLGSWDTSNLGHLSHGTLTVTIAFLCRPPSPAV